MSDKAPKPTAGRIEIVLKGGENDGLVLRPDLVANITPALEPSANFAQGEFERWAREISERSLNQATYRWKFARRAVAVQKPYSPPPLVMERPSPRLLDNCLPVAVSVDAVANLEEAYDSWVARYGEARARKLFRWQSRWIVAGYWVDWLLKRAGSVAALLRPGT